MAAIAIQNIGSLTPGVVTSNELQNVVAGIAPSNSKVTIQYLDNKNTYIPLGETTANSLGAFTYTLSTNNLSQIADSAVNVGAQITVNSIVATSTSSQGAASETSSPYSFLSLPHSKPLGNSGLSVQDMTLGHGDTATNSKLVVVDYTGFLQNGSVFDSSSPRNQPFAFQLGGGKVIAGWDQGVTGMQVGGERLLDIPASLGYGTQSVGSIPANSSLVFDVKLLNVFDPVTALVEWDQARGRPISVSDATALIFGGVLSSNNSVQSPLKQIFGNNIDLSSQNGSIMAFALDSGPSTIKAGQGGVSMLFGGGGPSVLNGAGNTPQFLFAGKGDASMIGSDSFDWIQGGAGNDAINAGGGNDFIVGSNGNDTIDGGAGFDVLKFTHAPDTVASIKNGAGYTLTLQFGDQQTVDMISNVERVKYPGSAIAFDIDGNAGQAYRVYQAAFDRKPDPSGLGFWIASMDKGATLKSVAEGFIGSAEFLSLYGNSPTSADFVNSLYKNVLHRGGEQAGVDFWNSLLNSGTSRADVLAGFSESPENKAGVIGSIQNGIHYTEYLT